jgi:hypothetical protein
VALAGTALALHVTGICRVLAVGEHLSISRVLALLTRTDVDALDEEKKEPAAGVKET